jgi:hypothetical protein
LIFARDKSFYCFGAAELYPSLYRLGQGAHKVFSHDRHMRRGNLEKFSDSAHVVTVADKVDVPVRLRVNEYYPEEAQAFENPDI